MSPKPLQSSETVLGYQLENRIGAGGYGEVWSAVAPGGLRKAVKFVFGYHDEKRAQAELKALDRVKELRHPFLLSLERIDIFDGQLVIVTEIAECSLADRFNDFINQGEPGIPRDELLTYIRDAADALDYLGENHSLQHLDVKPENLLIVSGHVKVADFGLIKDLNVASQSLMTGMTPAYAAPELFDGRPGDRSDQYSLAIVYQEMLTGVRPFPGNTPAQLAAQHMHGRPNLRALPKSDQPVIAKALSKDPATRFASCRAMVDELLNRKLRKKTIRRVVTEPRDSIDNTIPSSTESDGRDVTAILSKNALPFQAAEIVMKEPPECSVENAEFRPTVVIAVGHTAGKACLKLKQRLVARNGTMNEIPAVKLVCVDSDRAALGELSTSQRTAGLSDSEVVATPLRKPEVYRERVKNKLSWLSRRWIYNIPRTMQTEGLRPLGRLVFADHFEDICRRIEGLIADVCREENIAQTAERLGINPSSKRQPRVFIVTAVSGGISGMTLDLSYLVKSLLIEQGHDPNAVTGLLLNATNSRSREPGLSAANAFAFFTELRHFNDFGYPGDESLGIPEFQDEPPLDHTYYVDLGLDLKQTEFEEKLDSIAEWVYLNSMSRCSVFFDACRKLSENSEHFDLRTFGLSICGPGQQIAGHSQVDELTYEMVQKWIQGPRDPEQCPTEVVDEWFGKFGIDVEGISNYVEELTHERISDGQFNSFLTESSGIVLASGQLEDELDKYYDSIFGCPPNRKEVGYVEPELSAKFEEIISRDAIQLGDQLSKVVMNHLSGDRLDLGMPVEFVQGCFDRLDAIKNKLESESRACTVQLDNLVKIINSAKQKKGPESEELQSQCLQSYRQFRWQEFVLRNSRAFTQVIRSCLKSTESLLASYQTQLRYVARQFESVGFAPDMVPGNARLDMAQLMLASVFQKRKEIIDRAEVNVYQNFVMEQGGFQQMLSESSALQNYLPPSLRSAMVSVLADTYKKLSLDEIIADNHVSVDQLISWLNTKLNQARPDVRDCGGAARLLCGFPQLATKSMLPEIMSREFHVQCSRLHGTSGDFVLCFEGENLSMANVAYRLLEHRPDAAELAKRIHTRNDIEWSTLEDLL